MGYLDPGIFGMISQIAYLVLFAVVSALMFFFQPVKNLFNRVFRRGQAETPPADNEASPTSRPPGA